MERGKLENKRFKVEVKPASIHKYNAVPGFVNPR